MSRVGLHGSHQPDPDVARLRREVDDVIRRLSPRSEVASDVLVKVWDIGGDPVSRVQDAVERIQNSTWGKGTVLIGPGHYKCDRPITITGDVTLVGEGHVQLDFERAKGSFPDNGCIVGKGSLTALPALGSNITKNDQTITFASTVAALLSEDDVVVLRTTTQKVSPFRAYYYDGFMCRVVSVSAATVTIDRPAPKAFTTGDATLHRMNTVRAGVVGCEVLGLGTTATVAAVKIIHGRKGKVHDLVLGGSQWSLLALDRCIEMAPHHLSGYDYGTDGGTNYGFAVINSHDSVASDLHLKTRRHAASITGSDTDAAVPNYGIRIENSDLTGLDSYAADIHGNSIGCSYENCRCIGGAVIGGHANEIRDCDLTGGPSGRAFQLSELHGSAKLVGGRSTASKNCTGSVKALLLWTDTAQAISEPGATVEIVDHTIDMGAHTGDPGYFKTSATSDDISFRASGVRIKRDSQVAADSPLTVLAAAGSAWKHVVFEDCKSYYSGLYADDTGAKSILFRDCRVFEAFRYGIRADGDTFTVPWDTQEISVSGCHVEEAGYTGIWVRGNDDAKANATLKGNTSIRGNQESAAGGSGQVSFTLLDLQHVVLQGNTYGDDQGSPTQTALHFYNNVVEAEIGWNAIIGTVTAVNETLAAGGRQIIGYYHHNYALAAGTAAPTSGTWVAGDKVMNVQNLVGAETAWDCTVPGTPGTWRQVPQKAYRTSAAAPGVSSYYIGEEWLDTTANQWYKAHASGGGAADWSAI